MRASDAPTSHCCAAGRKGLDEDVPARGIDAALEGDSAREGDAARKNLSAIAAPVEVVRSRADKAILIPAGTFRMGTEDADRNPMDAESPIRVVEVGAFRVDPT